jgi:hypothetical protein
MADLAAPLRESAAATDRDGFLGLAGTAGELPADRIVTALRAHGTNASSPEAAPASLR